MVNALSKRVLAETYIQYDPSIERNEFPYDALMQAYNQRGEKCPDDFGLYSEFHSGEGEIKRSNGEGEETLYHGSSHVWIVRQGVRDGKERQEVLLQLRGKKVNYAGVYDISAAGHVDFGSDYLPTALRETREELGITIGQEKSRGVFPKSFSNIPMSDLFLAGRTFRDLTAYKKGVPEKEWVGAYVVDGSSLDPKFFEKNLEAGSVDSEVDKVRWVDLATVKEVAEVALQGAPDPEIPLIPQGRHYFDMVFDGMSRVLSQHE